MNDESKFGRNLKMVLDIMGMSQKELAEKTKLTESAVSQIINGQREPGLKSICAILRVLPVKFERLIQ